MNFILLNNFMSYKIFYYLSLTQQVYHYSNITRNIIYDDTKDLS